MKNFTKAFLVSLLMSGSFMVNAADWNEQELDRSLREIVGMSLQELRASGATDESLWEMVLLDSEPQPVQHQAPQHIELQFSEEDANEMIAATFYTENLLKIERKDQEFAQQLEASDKSFAVTERLERENDSNQEDHLLISENDDEAFVAALLAKELKKAEKKSFKVLNKEGLEESFKKALKLEEEASDGEDLHAAQLAAQLEDDEAMAAELAAELEREEKAERQRIAQADEEFAKQIAAISKK